MIRIALLGIVIMLFPLQGCAQAFDSKKILLKDSILMDFVWVADIKIWAARYEVSNVQYQCFMRFRDGCSLQGLALDQPDQPAVFVSYADALGFCYWMNHNAQLPAGMEIRLPDRKEWMHMADLSEEKLFLWGNTWPPSEGNFLDKKAGADLNWDWAIEKYEDPWILTAPVDKTAENALGLCGMWGNVREWTSDTAKDGNWHLILGGSWRDSDPEKLKKDFAQAGALWGRDNHIGFRVVLAPKTEK